MSKTKMSLVTLIVIATISLFTIDSLAIALGNQFSLLHRNGYFIPKESRIDKFQETMSSQGSGEYWLYAEDDQFYFYIGECGESRYSLVKKEATTNTPHFNRHDYRTWPYCSLPNYRESMASEEALACGDLLANFALKKPEHLEFIGCDKNPKVQYITRAEYRVTGEYSQIVEDYFIDVFDMPKLKIFAHTGWEPNGYGSIKIAKLSKINPNYELMVEMWGYARRDTDPDDENYFLLLPRPEIPYFQVYVSIANI